MSRDRVNEVDLLRFLAAVGVMLYHLSFRGFAADGLSPMPYPLLVPFIRYATLGLELFFIISGFVILMTISNTDLKGFVISRMVRLYPTFWVCCTLTFLVTIAFGNPPFTATLGQFLTNLTMLAGFLKVESIDGVYWSLYVELQFYVLAGLLMLIRQHRRPEPWILGWLGVTLLMAFYPVGKLQAIFLTPQAPYFILGALLFLVWREGLTGVRITGLLVAGGLGLWQKLSELPVMEAHYQTDLSPWIVGGLLVGCYLVMFLVATRRTGRFRHMRWIGVGAMSYPLYLLHQNIGFMLFYQAYPRYSPHLLLWGTVALMLVASFLVHRFVERPLGEPIKRWLLSLPWPTWTLHRPEPLSVAPVSPEALTEKA